MFRKSATLIALSFLLAACIQAQGLDTRASKTDWEEINFEFNSAVLSDGYPSLLRLADLLSRNPGFHVRVEGNTDNIGGRAYNEKLGLARANTVREFLIKYGAKPNQITATTRGKENPEAHGYKNRYSKTDVARWINRRVVLTVTDQNGRVVGDGGVNEAIQAVPAAPAPAGGGPNCCEDILKRLDKLDEIARMLKDLTDQNAGLRNEVDNLKKQQAALEDKINGMPKPLTEQQTSQVVDRRLEAFRDPRWSLLGLNLGADDRGHVTFTGAGRFFAPFKEHFGVQAQGEYMYFHDQKEAQFDIGLVNRIGRFQGGLFSSFKHVNLRGYGAGGTLGQGAAVFDYIFHLGKVGIFGTKGFLDNPILDRRNLVLSDGSIAPNIQVERFLHIVDQAGVQATIGLFRDVYAEGNIGYLRSYGSADRAGGTLRFVIPLGTRFAFTAEGGINETMMPIRGSNGRAVFGFQWGNLLRPKEFAESKYAIPMQVPRIRWEVVQRQVRNGFAPPIADAGPDQIGVPAGTITLNGSNSRDPNGLPLKFHWVQEAGPSVALSDPNAAITTFQATDGNDYRFRLTVTNTDGQSASARTRVTTRAAARVQILFFNANPTTIQAGQAATLAYRVLNATSVQISGIGEVNPSNGNLSVSPTQTTTYTLTAKNEVNTETATATVTVQTPQPQILACTVTPMNITAGESATIIYATQNATTVTIAPGVGSVPPNGSFVVTPTATTNYTLTATNQFASTTCSVTVSVTPGSAPRIVRFTGAPMTVSQGGTSTLVWQVENAQTVTITPNLGTVGLVGAQDVTLQQTTTYTLTATNQFGQATASVTITVSGPSPPPPNATITSFTANPPVSPMPGAPVVLTCLATNATAVTINGVGPVNSQGQVTVNPQTDTTYTCTATGNTGPPATATVAVKVTQPPPPVMNPPTVVIGGLNGLQCAAPTIPAGGGPSTVICQTVTRLVRLDLSQSTSPVGNTPLSFITTSRNVSSAVLNPTSSMPDVQLSELFGDYFFDVIVTDAKGNVGRGVVDIQYVRTTVR